MCWRYTVPPRIDCLTCALCGENSCQTGSDILTGVGQPASTLSQGSWGFKQSCKCPSLYSFRSFPIKLLIYVAEKDFQFIKIVNL